MKEQKKCKKTNEDAVTLIALIISIIVMLILAGVSINAIVGDDGIITQAVEAREQTIITSEKEKLAEIMVLVTADELQNPDETSSHYVGETLYDKNQTNSTIWDIIVINDTQEIYGTGWTYIKKGTELSDYGETEYAWLINYETGETVMLEEDTYTRLNVGMSVAVTDGLMFSIDPKILEDVTEDELKNDPTAVLGENVELVNFDWTEDSGLTSTSFNFDGVDDHINILYEDEEKLEALYENGLTFEFYGTVEKGSHVDYEGTDISSKSGVFTGIFGLWNGSETTQCYLRFRLAICFYSTLYFIFFRYSFAL